MHAGQLLTLAAGHGQGLRQFGELLLAFALSSLIGLERELRQKSAGLRTHTLVGVGAALFMLVSKYGFADVLVPGQVQLDPSRVAAQIVTGIGFIGGGLIFVRRDAVRGLTTAAIVWLTAAVGMACGGGLPLLAVVVTALHFMVVYGYTPLTRRLPRSRIAPSEVRVLYVDGTGVLRRVLSTCTGRGFVVAEVATEPVPEMAGNGHPTAAVTLQVQGRGSVSELGVAIGELDGVIQVSAGDVNETSD